MRRAVQAIIVSGTLLSAAACGTAAGPTPGVPAGTASAPAAAAPAAKTSCEALGQAYSKNMAPFAQALTDMVAARKKAGGDQGYPQVKESLTAFATGIRTATADSTDPRLKTDGNQTADRLQERAADEATFRKIKTTKDVNTMLGPTLKEWLSPVERHCS